MKEEVQASICEEAGYGAVDVCCIDIYDLLQSVTRRNNLDEGEK